MKRQIELVEAERVAKVVVATLSPFVEKIEVCGSVRRRKLVVGDVDIILGGVKDGFVVALLGMGGTFAKVSGSLEIDGVSVDVEVMPLETWSAAVMYRTGSAEENVRLRGIARSKGWKLSQYGLRIRDTGELLPGQDSEKAIYELLGERYLRPEDRSGTRCLSFGEMRASSDQDLAGQERRRKR